MSSPLRVALADDQELFLESLSALFANTGGEVEVIWSARNGEETLEKALAQKPDVLLLDYSFKGKTQDGGEICRLMSEQCPGVGILMLSVSYEISVIRETLRNGALGYASKDIGKAELLNGIRTVARGEYFFDQTALTEIVQHFSGIKTGNSPDRHYPLTPREFEVALIYAKGTPAKEIAATLYISEDTVESHIKSIRSKLDAKTRYDVEKWLKSRGLWEE